jgi:hypothetical protein
MRNTSLAIILFLAFLALTSATEGDDYQERVLSFDAGTADAYSQLYSEAARVDFQPVKAWAATYVTGVSIYARRYGSGSDPSKSYANVAITDKEGKVLAQKLVPYSKFPTDAAWVKVELPTLKVTDVFCAIIFPYARADFGIEIGHSEKSKAFRSFQGNPSAGYKLVEGKFDWMIRVSVRNKLEPLVYIDANQISGINYLHYDDGSPDGFFTFQRGGALVGFKNQGFKKLNDVFLYGRVEGDWFSGKPTFRVFLLDRDLRMITSVQRDYAILTELPHWTNVDFPDADLPGDFYILVEPVSRPEALLYLGYDTSDGKHPNYYGTVGTFFDWPLPEAKDEVNWMIRVKVS